MKKIFLLLAAIGLFVACDPVQEDISNAGHITLDDLLKNTSVTVDNDGQGHNGNIITCQTSAPVNAKWEINGKQYLGNYSKNKMRVGEYIVKMTALCPDGEQLTADFPINCEVETDPIKKKYFYGEDPVAQPEFWLESGDAAGGRFSSAEGKYFPYLDDDTFNGLKTLVFEITDAEEGPFIWGDGVGDVGLTLRVMSGWWDGPFADNVVPTVPYWELTLTEDMAKTCAQGATAHDLDIMMTRGRIKIKACYYEY